MVVEIIRNGVKFYVHTAWANDTAGTDFSLTEYEEALFVGNYIDRSSAESNLPVKYAWKEIHKVDDENVSATEDGLTDYEERMSDLEASARENADDLAGTQQSTDSAIGNPNLLLNTNNGTANYSTTIGYSIEELVDSIGEGTEYIKCVKVTCNTPSDSGMLFFNADSLRDVLGSAVDENTYTLSMHTRMSTLFDIELIAVQNSDGANQQLVYDVLSNASEDDDVILDDEWVFYESTTQCTEVASDAQMLCMSLANMPAGAYLIIANLKIEAGAIATPWRESVEEVSREVKVIHEKVVVTEAEVKKVSGELASFKTGEFENLKAGVAEIEKAYIKAADVETIIAGKGYITDLQTKTLLSDYAKVTTLESDYVKTNQLEAKVGTFGYLKTTSLESEVGKFGYLKATSLESEVGKFGYLKASELEANVGTFGYIKATDVAAKYATIDLANVKAGSITQAMIGQGVVGTAQIANSSITDAKIVELTANKINAGTLSVERLEIRGTSNSIVYALNNITGALQAQNVDTLNGEVLTPRTITADKIVANAITANEIASKTITANNILAGTITATEIKSNTITANQIAAGTITATEIKSGTITADKINVADLFAQQITVTGSLTGNINRTKITDNGMEIMDASGNTVARYGTNVIDLGIASEATQINLCGGLGNIKGTTHDSGALSALGINANILKLNATGTTGYLSLNVAKTNGYSGSFVLSGTGSDAYADLTLKNGTTYAFRTDRFDVPVKIWASDIYSETDMQAVRDLYVGGDIYGYKFQGPTGGRPTYNGDRIALMSDIDNAAAGVDLTGYIKNRGLLGRAVTNANATNIAVGIYTLNNSSTTNLPATGLYGAFFQYPGDHKPQMVIGGPDGVGTIYTRRYLTGSSSWTAWAKMVTTADLSGYALADHTHNYLPMSGGMLEGSLKFQSSSLPQKNLEYICGIDAFAAGGEMGWQSKENFLAGYATTAYVDSKVASGGSFTFANNTLYNIGDDVQIGDQNVAGTLCVKGTNGTTAIQFMPYNDNAVTTKIVSNDVSSYGGLRVTGLKGGYHGILFGDNNTDLNIMSCDPHQGLYNESNGTWILYYNRIYDQMGIGCMPTTDSTFRLQISGNTWIGGSLTLDSFVLAKGAVYEYGTTLSSRYAALNHSHPDHALTGSANIYNGEQKFQNSSYCPTVSDTAPGVGCAFKASRGMANELLVDKIIATAATGRTAFYRYTGASNGSMTGLAEVASIGNGDLSLKPISGEGGQIILEAAANDSTHGGTIIDNCWDNLRIFGMPSRDGTTHPDVGSVLVINPFTATITGGYSFDGTAAKATADANGRNIINTYATKSELNAAVVGSHNHAYIYNGDGLGQCVLATTASGSTYYFRHGGTYTYHLGGANYRWNTIYSVNALNTSSDLKFKTDISKDLDKYVKMMDFIDPITFIRTNSPEDKRHVGYGAQHVESALIKVGLTVNDFAGLSKERDSEQADYSYGLTYEEFIPILHARQNRDKSELNMRLKALEGGAQTINMKYDAALMKIAELEKRIDQLELAS